ncbi:MAG: 23S rRNA (uracil(1939)-C(5))-methyltransferase RlmD [Firmicutes bacterium]|nr:23S rRNA (uracil(1939)-C(5))-methyltransferase RlmD [Bacillota bacterium]
MKKLEVGQELIVPVEGLTHDGKGVGRAWGSVVFIPQAVPGDLVKIRLKKIKKRISWGHLKEILIPSAQRRQPSCPHAAFCGGCQLQHLDYNAQLYWKKQRVKDALERIGKLEAPILPTIGMDNPWGYRNKARFHFRSAAGEIRFGFFKKKTHRLVQLEQCPIHHPSLIFLAKKLREASEKLQITAYDEKTGRGILKEAILRVSFHQEKLMLILATAAAEIPRQESLIRELTSAVPQLVSIVQRRKKGKEAVRLLWGEPHLVDSIGPLEYLISPSSFFQVNSTQTKILYDEVLKRVSWHGGTVADLYCGAGTIGLYLAGRAKRVLGVEITAAAVEDAGSNAQLNKVENTEFAVGKAEDFLPFFCGKYGGLDYVILNPPRGGCSTVLLEKLVQSRTRNVIYVSCNPETFARDLGFLHKNGFIIGPVQPVDMFPWTAHVECVVLMRR